MGFLSLFIWLSFLLQRAGGYEDSKLKKNVPNYGSEEQVKPGQAGQPLFSMGSEGYIGKSQNSIAVVCPALGKEIMLMNAWSIFQKRWILITKEE